MMTAMPFAGHLSLTKRTTAGCYVAGHLRMRTTTMMRTTWAKRLCLEPHRPRVAEGNEAAEARAAHAVRVDEARVLRVAAAMVAAAAAAAAAMVAHIPTGTSAPLVSLPSARRGLRASWWRIGRGATHASDNRPPQV